MSERQAVVRKLARNYMKASRAEKSRIIDNVVELTDWNRDYARKSLVKSVRTGDIPRVKQVRNRPRKYGPDLLTPLIICWSAIGMPCGKCLSPFMTELVPRLRNFGEITVTDAQAQLLISMSAATMDRLLHDERKKHLYRGYSHTKPGTLLKSQIPIRTWAEWNDARPGFFEIDLVGHDGGDLRGEHCFTLTATDIATGWTEIRSIKNKAAKWVTIALEDMEHILPFPILGIDSDNGSEFINDHLYRWCQNKEITFTRSRPYHSN